MMSLALDHIVIAVADLDAAFADYTRLGFTAIRGGEHANGITHNVLVVFADGAYLELIAFRRADPGNRWSDIFEHAGEGFVDYALLPDNIDKVVFAAQERGLDIEDPQPGGRHRPDGARLEWKTARSPRPDIPFLCGDVTPRALRVQEGDVRRHANGVSGVAALTIAVEHLETSLRRNAALLGEESAEPIDSGIVSGSPAHCATLALANGTRVTLACPTGTEGALAATLSRRGEGPFAVSFRGSRDHGELDRRLTHGARLSIVKGEG
jgi:catechol 2,3-dioxygenase-like lactoylglutathione lyase family enzyme